MTSEGPGGNAGAFFCSRRLSDLVGFVFGIEPAKRRHNLAVGTQFPFLPAADLHVVSGLSMMTVE